MKAKLIFKDEVNVKIEGLDLSTRKFLVDKFKFKLPYAYHLPSVKLGRWDGCVNFFNLGGSTYINLLVDILPELENRGYDFEIEDNRPPQKTWVFEEVCDTTYKKFKWPKGHLEARKPIILRDYQVEIINKFLANPQSIQEVATGAGKTIITAALSERCEKYGRTMVIVPNKSLVVQTEKDYKILGLDVGVFYGDRKEYGHKHTICTWQSLNNLFKNTKKGEADIGAFIDGVVCIMIDEVHMAKAEVLKTLLTGVFSHITIRWGLTGTVPKDNFDFFALKVSIGEVINTLKTSTLQDIKVLSECHVNIFQFQDYVEFKTYPKELEYLTTEENRVKYLAKLIQEINQSGNTLVLVTRVKTGKLLEQMIPNSIFISGATKVAVRSSHYDEVANVDDKIILATYGVAAVGINIPRIFNLVLIEPGKSFVRVIQSIGRGIRKAHDKDFVQIWDFTSTCKFSKRHLTKRKAFYKEANFPFEITKVNWK